MTKLALIGVVLIVTGGCKDSNKPGKSDNANPKPGAFGPKGIRQVEIEGFVIPVPDGYRDSSEIADAKHRAQAQGAAPPGGNLFVSESNPSAGGLILVVAAVPVRVEASPEGCAAVGQRVAKGDASKLVRAAVHPTKVGASCVVELRDDGNHTQYHVPFGDRSLFVLCSAPPGDAALVERDVVCASVVAGIARR